jgi:hypothetical protein
MFKRKVPEKRATPTEGRISPKSWSNGLAFESEGDITRLLHAMTRGDSGAEDD